MKRITALLLPFAILMLAGCQLGTYNAQRKDDPNTIYLRPSPDLPTQVVYRIDDHRFISLENYDRCWGDNYYNDTRLGIHTKFTEGRPNDYRGRLIVDDPSGMNIAIPTVWNTTCGDRGCKGILAYSTDRGQTFRWLDYMNNVFSPAEDSERYTVAVTKDALYVAEQSQYDVHVRKFPLAPQIDLNKPYPTGLLSDSGWASKKRLLPSGLRSPSGQERFTCDASIRPMNLDTPLR